MRRAMFVLITVAMAGCDPGAEPDFEPRLAAEAEDDGDAEESGGETDGPSCPDPTLGAYMVWRNGVAMPGWVFTFYEDGTWELDLDGAKTLSGEWWFDDDDPCLIHYTNPDDNGGQGSEADFRWDGDSWNKEGGSHPNVTIELQTFL